MASYQLIPQEDLTVARYLERYAEPLVHDLEKLSLDFFETVIVIPFYDETDTQIKGFLDFLASSKLQSILMVWVFNAPEKSLNSPSLVRTKEALKRTLKQTEAHTLSDTVSYTKITEASGMLQILFIDRCHGQLIPDKQGVGLARKLGMDLALKAIYKQFNLTGDWCYWIYSTDADVYLPQEYGSLPVKENTVACIYPFKHTLENGFEKAMMEYEFSLHYYVDSLKKSGSPYAFHTIGSLIVVSAVAYAQVRGVPKRAGAEDFYLLNKLAKLGKIENLSEPCIEVSGRPSQRVPFGTGPALVKINSLHETMDSFCVYHPRIFTILESVLRSVSEIEHSSSQEDILLSRLQVKLSDTHEAKIVIDILKDMGIKKQETHLQSLKTGEARLRAFHVWFDAFITLRFIHELRDRLYPNVELTELPELLAKEQGDKVIRGTRFDYTNWFNALGI